MKNKVIALVGMCGSGKSVASEYFQEKGYGLVYFGGVTMEELEKRGLEVNQTNEKMVREGLRKEYGMGAFAVLLLPKIEKLLKKGNVIADGLYSWSEYKIFAEKYGENFKVIAVFTPKEERYERLSKREIRPLTKEEAYKRDIAEIENIEKGGPIAMADYTLINNGSKEDLLENLKKLNL